MDDKEIVYHSGDGTVPYDSLRYPLTWRDKIAEGVQVNHRSFTQRPNAMPNAIWHVIATKTLGMSLH